MFIVDLQFTLAWQFQYIALRPSPFLCRLRCLRQFKLCGKTFLPCHAYYGRSRSVDLCSLTFYRIIISCRPIPEDTVSERLKKCLWSFYYYFILQLCCMGFLPWEIRVAFSPGKANCDRVALPNRQCMVGVFSRFHSPTNSDIDCRISNVRKDVNARGCTRGCTDTVREPALKVDSGRKILCRTGESNLPQRRAGPTPCQLSYIPSH